MEDVPEMRIIAGIISVNEYLRRMEHALEL
jgi:hypothetical protein